MANEQSLEILSLGFGPWNQWIKQNRKTANLVRADLQAIDLSYYDFRNLDLWGANLQDACLDNAVLSDANLSEANLDKAELENTSLARTNLNFANLQNTRIRGANFRFSSMIEANLDSIDANHSDFTSAIMRNASMVECSCNHCDFTKANMTNINLTKAELLSCDFSDALLTQAILNRVNFLKGQLNGADLSFTQIKNAKLVDANLNQSNLNNADLSDTFLTGSSCIGTNFMNAILENTNVYGISAWDVKIEGSIQKNLVITRPYRPSITVDNLELANFIYLILNNEKIRDVIGTIAKKGVLILGRFTPERKKILDVIRSRLRDNDFVPIMFDFDKVSSRDFTETIKILAGISRFVIADITNPSSAPLELQAIVPDYRIPFLPIIEDGEKPFSMFSDLNKYPWVEDLIQYKSEEDLMTGFQQGILARALSADAKLAQQKQPIPTILNFVDFK